MAVMTGTNRNRRRPETESAEEAERHTRGYTMHEKALSADWRKFYLPTPQKIDLTDKNSEPTDIFLSVWVTFLSVSQIFSPKKNTISSRIW